MKIKDNKGITLLTLVITVIVLAIIASVSVSMGLGMLETAKFENIQTDLLLIQSKSKMMAEGIAMGEIPEDEIRGQKQTEGEYIGWYKLSQQDLNEIGVTKAKAEDGYYVNYEEEDVLYARGATIEDQTFFKLSEILAYINAE